MTYLLKKITSPQSVNAGGAANQNTEDWVFGKYLFQYVIFEALHAVSSTYATGITDSIKRGVTFFFVPDDLFTIGNSVLHSMI